MLWSLPSRGAWIEIAVVDAGASSGTRRSPRGGRGLKYQKGDKESCLKTSLPSRGAWIEISDALTAVLVLSSRSPRGGRGLKSHAVKL